MFAWLQLRRLELRRPELPTPQTPAPTAPPEELVKSCGETAWESNAVSGESCIKLQDTVHLCSPFSSRLNEDEDRCCFPVFPEDLVEIILPKTVEEVMDANYVSPLPLGKKPSRRTRCFAPSSKVVACCVLMCFVLYFWNWNLHSPAQKIVFPIVHWLCGRFLLFALLEQSSL